VLFFILIKNVAIVPVNIPIKPIPVSIRIAAIILPGAVIGDISPYPTVVDVTKLHHRASPKESTVFPN
jgi:biotin transporter BioY